MIVECRECNLKFRINSPTELLNPATQAEHMKAYGHAVIPREVEDYNPDADLSSQMESMMKSQNKVLEAVTSLMKKGGN